MATARRAGGTTLVLVCLALVAWLATRGRASFPSQRSRSAAQDVGVEDADAPAPDRRRQRGPVRAGAPAGAPPQASPIEPSGDALFPALRVEVRRADGTWPEETPATAYALRPGDSGAAGAVATSELGPDGTATLRLPGHGVYDVGASETRGFVWAVEPGVDTRLVNRVRIALPPTDEVTFVLDPLATPGPGDVTVSASGGPEMFESPGVGGIPSHGVEIDIGDLPFALQVARGLRLHVEKSVDAWFATPQEFSAPAGVTIGEAPWGMVELCFSAEPQDATAPYPVRVGVECEIVGGGRVDRWDGISLHWVVETGKPIADVFRSTFCQAPPAKRSVLRWTGDGVRAGSLDLEAPDAGVLEVPVVLQLEPPFTRKPAAVVFIDAPPGVASGTLRAVEGDESCFCIEADVPTGIDHVVGYGAFWQRVAAQVFADGLVTQPFRLDRPGRALLSLLPGGTVRVVRGVAPPEGVVLVLRRADGLPFMYGDPPGSGDFHTEVELDEPAVVVGPLPEGDVALVVSYGRTPLVEFTAQVRGGETTEARLPLAERLSR